MGYAVYWMNNRFQGYGVPAYCDCPGCQEKIDRGLGYQHEEEDRGAYAPSVFVCNNHQTTPIDEIDVDCSREHPEWLKHVLTDDSWKQWREENPERVKMYQLSLSLGGQK